MRRRAQSAAEYLMVLGVVMAVLSVLFSVSYQMMTASETKMRNIKAQDMVQSLGKAAELVYQEGDGSMTKVYITVPDGVTGISGNATYLQMNVSLGGDTVPFSYQLDFPAVMNVTTAAGSYWATVESVGDHVVISAP